MWQVVAITVSGDKMSRICNNESDAIASHRNLVDALGELCDISYIKEVKGEDFNENVNS